MIYFSTGNGPNSDIYTSFQIPHDHSNDIVNYEVWQYPLPHAYHIVRPAAHVDIILFSYNPPPDVPYYVNDLMTLNDYWIRVNDNVVQENYNEVANVPEISTFTIFVSLLFIFCAKKLLSKPKKHLTRMSRD